VSSEAVLCTVYKGSRERELYVYVARERGLDAVPADLVARMGKITEVMTLMLTPAKKLARVDAARVLHEIRERGYYLQLPPEITGAALGDAD